MKHKVAISQHMLQISDKILRNSCKFRTEETADAQNFNFASKFWFWAPNVAFLDQNFQTKITFSDSPKFSGAIGFPAPPTLSAMRTLLNYWQTMTLVLRVSHKNSPITYLYVFCTP